MQRDSAGEDARDANLIGRSMSFRSWANIAPHPSLQASTCDIETWCFNPNKTTSHLDQWWLASSLETVFMFLLSTEIIHFFEEVSQGYCSGRNKGMKSLKCLQSPRKRWLQNCLLVWAWIRLLLLLCWWVFDLLGWFHVQYFNFSCVECTFRGIKLHANFSQSLKELRITCKGSFVCHCPLNCHPHGQQATCADNLQTQCSNIVEKCLMRFSR